MSSQLKTQKEGRSLTLEAVAELPSPRKMALILLRSLTDLLRTTYLVKVFYFIHSIDLNINLT